MCVNKYIKSHQRYLKLKLKKLRDKCKSRYLISKYITFTVKEPIQLKSLSY